MLKRFVYWASGKKVELEILEKVTENKLKVNVTVDGKEIAREVTANICRINTKPSNLYLNFNDTYLTICDKKKSGSEEKNREIADWIWENLQNGDVYATAYGFTTDHWRNWEQY